MATIHGTPGNDELNYSTSTSKLKIEGEDGNDTLIGGFNDDDLKGEGGNDFLDGGAGDDDLDGGDGNDTLLGGDGRDKLDGKDGDDSLDGGAGNDDLKGDDGNDTLRGGAGDDKLDGGKGDNLLDGGAGDDNLKGDDGNDTLLGGDGDDKLEGKDGNDSLDGGAGDDDIKGGKGDDTLLGGSGNDKIKGDDGNDLIFGGAGDDDIKADKGDDTIAGGLGDDKIDGGSDTDTAVFAGSILDFLWQPDGGDKYIVTDMNAGDGDMGTDELKKIELLQFDDYTLDLTGGNNAPLVVVGDQTTDEDSSLGFGVQAYDFDGDPLTLVSYSFTGTGLTLVGGPVALTPLVGTGAQYNFNMDPGAAYQYLAVGESVVETLSLTVSDGNGGTTSYDVDVTVTGVNDAPVALRVSGAANEDGPSVTVLANFTDVDASDTHTFTVNLGGTLGSVVNNGDGSFTYSPNGAFETLAQGQTAIDTFTYTVTDNNGGFDTETVKITITGQNDAPVALAVAAEANEDGPAVAISADFTDVDAGDTHTFAVDTTGTLGSVIDNGDGTFSYDANGQFETLAVGDTATDTFTYTVTDYNGLSSTETVTVTVNGQNDDPVAVDDSATTDEDTAVNIVVLDDDTDIDGDTLSVSAASAANGNVVIEEDGTLTYTPNENYNGADTITYTVSDGNGGEDIGTVAITINPINDAPVTDAPDDPVAIVDEANGLAVINLNSRVSDPDGDTVTVLVARLIDPNTGSSIGIPVSVVAGVARFDPSLFGLGDGQSRAVQLEYLVRDDSGAPNNAAIGRVDIIVNGADDGAPPTNNAPVAGDLAISADEALGDVTVDLSGVISDADLDTLTVVALVANGNEITFTQSGTSITFDPQQFGLNEGQQDVFAISYTIDDGANAANSQATGTITLTLDGADDGPPPPPTNIAPVANAVVLEADEANGAIQVDLNAFVQDADAGDVLTIRSVTAVGGFAFEYTLENGVLTIDPASLGLDTGDEETFLFEYTVEDSSGQSNNSATGTISLDLIGFTEGVTPEPTSIVLDFETYIDAIGVERPIEDPIGSAITLESLNGFRFTGYATVIETDEIDDGVGRDPSGLTLGQTTEGGSNVLAGSNSFIQVLVIDPETELPVTETVLDEVFGFYAPGSTTEIGAPAIIAGPVNTGAPAVPEGFGDGFNLDGLSLNVASGEAVSVTVTTYGVTVTEVAYPVPGYFTYEYELTVADTFVFSVDASNAAEVLDFNAAIFGDEGYTNTGAFDDIYAITFETDTGVAVVLDDVLITL